MKKIIAILLFFILGLSIFGLYPLLKIMQYHARLEMAIRIRNGVPAKDLHQIVFIENKRPDWTKTNKEFFHEGHLYDVVEEISRGDSTVYLCLKDTKETKLDQQLKRLAAMNTRSDFQNKANQKRPTNFYKFQYLSWNIPSGTIEVTTNKKSYSFQQYIDSLKLPPPVPPPEYTPVA
jgi:hypothetical protein